METIFLISATVALLAVLGKDAAEKRRKFLAGE